MQGKKENEAINPQVIWTAIRCWWLTAGTAGVVLACTAAYAMYLITPPNYTASAWLQIREKSDSVLAGPGIAESNKYVENQLELMKSSTVIDQVVSASDVGSTPELIREANPAHALRQQLKVKRQGKSDYYVIEFTSQIPSRAALIPNRIVQAYLNIQGKEENMRGTRVIDLLAAQQKAQQEIISTLRGRISQLSKELTGKDPYGAEKVKDDNSNRNVASQLKAQLVHAEVDHEFLKAEIRAEIEALEKLQIESPKDMISLRVAKDPRVLALIAKGDELQKKAAEVVKVTSNPQKSPKYTEIQEAIAQNKTDVENLRKEIVSELDSQIEQGAKANRDSKITELKQKVERSEFMVSFLRDRVNKELVVQKEYQGESTELAFLKSDYERAVDVANLVGDRLYKMRLEQQAPSRSELFQEAVVPKLPDQTPPYKKMLMVALLALALPFGLAVAFEAMHMRVNSKKQLDCLDVPFRISEVAELPQRNRSLITGQRDKRIDLFIESVDGLRTNMMAPTENKGFRVFAVTSAISGEGKTSLSTQLAVSLASATDKPTLLIDGDLRYPDIHSAFDVELSPGVADVIDQKCSVMDAIVLAKGTNLYILPAGRLKGNPHRITASGQFNNMIGELRKYFQYIVIDTPPVLAASEAISMAKTADASLLVTRRDHSRIHLVKEASERIASSGSNLAGVVLSGVPTHLYQYRYGAYYHNEGRDVS